MGVVIARLKLLNKPISLQQLRVTQVTVCVQQLLAFADVALYNTTAEPSGINVGLL